MTVSERSILSWRQVLLLLFLGRPFSPGPFVISGGDQRRESKDGWWAGGPVLRGEGVPVGDFQSSSSAGIQGSGFTC